MADTTAGAMKEFICYIKNYGTTPDDIADTNVTALWNCIGEAFNKRFNDGSGASIGVLIVTCREGATAGTTHSTVTGATGSAFRYTVGTNLFLPSAGG